MNRRSKALLAGLIAGTAGTATSQTHAQCTTRPECQATQLTTAYNTFFMCAETITPSESGTITAACLEGVFWDGGPIVECSGSEHWFVKFYEDSAGLPGTLIAEYEAGDGVGTPTMTVTKTAGVGTHVGLPLRIMEFSGLSAPVTSGSTYHISVQNTESCWFLWLGGQPGDHTALQDLNIDGFDAGDFLAEDLNFCFNLDAATTACSDADITTQGAGVGDPGFGVPDGIITAADINFYVNAWGTGDTAIADVTTQGAGVGDPGFGVPDGLVTAADINYYVNLWVAGCP